MKINLEGAYLVIVTTLGCNSACGHCLYSCCPEKSELRFSGDEMKGILQDARAKGISQVCFSGGEPMIFPEDLFDAIAEADKLGYALITVRTNGFWAVDTRVTEKTILALQSCGVTQIGISPDNYHSPFVSFDNAMRIMQVAEQVEMSVWIDWVGKESGKYAWETLGKYMRLMRGNPTPPSRVGRARTLPNEQFNWFNLEQLEFESPFSFSCGNPSGSFLLIYPNGYAHLHTCCLPNPRLFKRVLLDGDWLDRLVNETENDPAVEFLYEYGVGGLLRKARLECPELLRQYYTSTCEVCWELLGRLFPAERINAELLFGRNGHKANIRQPQLMAKGLVHRIDRISREYVREVEGGYSLIPNFGKEGVL